MNTTDYKTAKTRVDIALDESGIGHDVQERVSEDMKRVAEYMGYLQKSIVSQLMHNHFTNNPCGILKGRHFADHAIKQGTVSAIGHFLEWNISPAIEFAADICEEVNAHDEAATIRAMIYAKMD